VVVTVVPAACNCDPATNPVPITSNSPVVAPKFTVTAALVTAGIGFHTATVAAPPTVGVSVITAVMVTASGLGIAGGGVYNPVAEIVPTVLDPP
jgi:hypothetical protein